MIDVDLDASNARDSDLLARADRPAAAIAREALSNVARHSRATRGSVHVETDDGGIKLIISDNGVGFDPHKPRGIGPPGPGQHARPSFVCREPTGGPERAWRSARVSSWKCLAAKYPAASPNEETMTDQIEARPLRLLVVDDHEVVRQGLVSLLERREHFQVVAEAGTAAEAIEMARKFEPDLVVMDVRLPDGSGIEACREIRAEFPATRVVILTSYPDEEAVLSAIVAGACGYLLKQIRGRDLVAALESVGRGESLLDPAVTEKVLDRVRRIATGTYTDEMAQLTQQEQKILLLVAEGKTNKEIASEVFLSDKTVKNYVSSILSKLNLERRAAGRRVRGPPPA